MVTKKATNNTAVDEAAEKQSPKATDALSYQIWNRIKDIDLEMFALPNQFVEVNATPIFDISDKELHLLLKADAALPQLEEKLRGVMWDRNDPSKKLELYQDFLL